MVVAVVAVLVVAALLFVVMAAPGAAVGVVGVSQLVSIAAHVRRIVYERLLRGAVM